MDGKWQTLLAVSARKAATPRRSPSVTKAVPAWTIISAGLPPVLLTAGWLAAGALQPASYDPVRQTVSVLAGHAGTDRWIMTGALFLIGGCYLVTAAGLTGIRVPARILLIAAGLASIGIAASPEPVKGSTPQHLAWTSFGAVMIAVWPAFAARRAERRTLILGVRGAAAVTAVFVALLGWVVTETPGGRVLGLAERLTASVETTWPFIVALALRRVRTPTPPGRTACQDADPAARRPGAWEAALDLGSQPSMTRIATHAAGLTVGRPLHGLACNAGWQVTERPAAADGFEAPLGAGHIGHAALISNQPTIEEELIS